MIIYKIFRASEYAEFMAKGRTIGAPVDVADGFIHFSTAEQVAETVAKHFAADEGLMLLALESDLLEPLKWEVSRGGAEFPHLYRALMAGDILWAKPLPLIDGAHDFSGLM